MNWNNIKITIFKEIRGVFRDKKTIQKYDWIKEKRNQFILYRHRYVKAKNAR